MTVIDFAAFIGRLATSSGDTILPFFRTSLTIDNKQPGRDFDPVTEADRAAEAVMRRLIKASFPQHGIVGEVAHDAVKVVGVERIDQCLQHGKTCGHSVLPKAWVAAPAAARRDRLP